MISEKLNLDLVFEDNKSFDVLIKNQLIPVVNDTFSTKVLISKNNNSFNPKSLLSTYKKNIETIKIDDFEFNRLLEIFSLSIYIYQSHKNETLDIFHFLLQESIKAKASDVHLEPYENLFIVRFRIDGTLYEKFILNELSFNYLNHKIKIASNLDLVTTFVALDSRFSRSINNISYDFRVSVLPMLDSCSIVLRILDKYRMLISLDKLGINKQNLFLIKRALNNLSGLILIAGPTGSGKTTTLYSILDQIKNSEKKIITIEDPIEYKIDNIVQTQVHRKQNFNFTNALRGILRHDPDVLMIGEIRDKDSVEIALNSALTGHLIFSTIHTNSAIETLVRLQQLGIDNFLIIHTLSLVHFQRLIRVLCPKCKKQTKQQKSKYIKKEYKVYSSSGCQNCSNTGFISRKVVSETIYIDEGLKELILLNSSKSIYLKYLKSKSFKTIFEDALNCYLKGLTSIEEIMKIDYIQYEKYFCE
jgi:general secretion pathway protein E